MLGCAFAQSLGMDLIMEHRVTNRRPNRREELEQMAARKRRLAVATFTWASFGGVLLLPLGCTTGAQSEYTDTQTAANTTGGSPSSQSMNASLSRDDTSIDTRYDSAPLFTAQPLAPSATIADESSKPVITDAPLQVCVASSGPGEDLVIDDFEDGDSELPQQEDRSGRWYAYEETTGDHGLVIAELETPRLGSTWAAHTSSTEHGDWAGFGVQLSECVYDASGYVGLHFWIRGTSAPINVAILTPGVVPVDNGGSCVEEEGRPCWDSHKHRIEVTDEWREHFLPFSTFAQAGYGQDAGPLDLKRMRSLEFQSEAGAFDVWVDDVSFYIEAVYTPLDPDADDAGVNDSGSSDSDEESDASVDASGSSDLTSESGSTTSSDGGVL